MVAGRFKRNEPVGVVYYGKNKGATNMDEKQRQAISEDAELLKRGETLADMLQRADGAALMGAIQANDEKGIAAALDMPVDQLRAMGAYFHDKAVRLAELHPSLREAASYFGSKE